jgi:hypothetical protein
VTPAEFADTCHTLGLTNGDVALITGNTTRAVQYWLTGKNDIPQSVAILLNGMAAGQIDMDWVADEVSRITEAQAARA